MDEGNYVIVAVTISAKKEEGEYGIRNPKGTFSKISKQELKQYIQELKNQKNIDDNAFNSSWLKNNGHGGYVQRALNLYGKWNDFLKEFDPLPFHLQSKQDLILSFEKLYKIHGKEILTTRGLKKVNPSLQHFIGKRFDDWSEFRLRVDPNPPTPRSTYSNLNQNECINKFKEIVQEHGEKAKKSQFINKNYSGFRRRVFKIFNNWEDLLSKSGFENKFKAKEDWKNKDLISFFKKLYEEKGNKVLSSHWMKNKYSGFFKAVLKKHGSWEDFLEKAGFELKVRPDWKNKDLVSYLKTT